MPLTNDQIKYIFSCAYNEMKSVYSDTNGQIDLAEFDVRRDTTAEEVAARFNYDADAGTLDNIRYYILLNHLATFNRTDDIADCTLWHICTTAPQVASDFPGYTADELVYELFKSARFEGSTENLLMGIKCDAIRDTFLITRGALNLCSAEDYHFDSSAYQVLRDNEIKNIRSARLVNKYFLAAKMLGDEMVDRYRHVSRNELRNAIDEVSSSGGERKFRDLYCELINRLDKAEEVNARCEQHID